MNSYPARDDSIQLLRETADIAEVIGEHVTLKRAGINLKGLCPFHSEKTPSFVVNPDRRTFHCFGCGEGGDVFAFMMKYHNLAFPEAVKELARRYNITLPEKSLSPAENAKAQKRQSLFDINEKAAELFHQLLLHAPQAEIARRYLADRGVPENIIKDFRLGYAPDSWDYLTKQFSRPVDLEAAADTGLLVAKDRGGHYDRFRSRLVFPILGQTGKVVGFSGRILGDGQPKYLNSPESLVFEKGKTVFGIYQNRDSVRQAKVCVLVEGNFDLLSLVIHDIKNVAAPLGTALTQAQVRLLKGYAEEVIILFDGDEAGIKAAMRAVPIFLSEQLAAKVALLPPKQDPDTFLTEYGVEKMTSLLSEAKPLTEFIFDQLAEQYGLSLEGKNRIITELRPLISATSDHQSQRSLFAAHFSRKLGLSVEQLLKGSVPTPVVNKPPENKKTSSLKEISLKERQLLEFLIIFPEYLQVFLEAGVNEIIDNASGRQILEGLIELEKQGAEPDHLLDFFSGEEKSFIAGLLISTPNFSEEDKEIAADEKLVWLKKFSLKKKQEHLTAQINQAQKALDVKLCLELIEKKRALEQSLSS